MNLVPLFFASIILIIISYFLIDSPLVFFVHEHGINHYSFLKLLTHIPDVIIGIIIVYVILFPFLYKKYKENRLFHMLFLSTISVSLAAQIKDILKFVFGRYWPDTWIDGNPSLLVNHEYGFHFFQKGSAYTSFPSGHATATFAFFAICILYYPKYKMYFLIPMFLLSIGQVFVHYHFLSDVIAGGCLGWCVSKLICHYDSSALRTKLFP